MLDLQLIPAVPDPTATIVYSIHGAVGTMPNFNGGTTSIFIVEGA